MKKDEIFDLEIRKRIYNFILKYPGLHLRELIRKLNIPNGTLRYHLNYLKNRDLIKNISEDGYVRYYIVNKIGTYQQKILHILRQEVPRNIVLYFLLVCCASQIELSKSLEKHPTTIEFHLKKLINMGIVEQARVDDRGVIVDFGGIEIIDRNIVRNEIIYRLKDPYSAYDSIILYKKKSLNDNYCNLPTEAYKFWASVNMPKTNKGISLKKYFESYEKIFLDIFPHPYHA